MNIISLKLAHFRSVEKCKVDLSNVTALVGENNSGKSALLRAMNAFFNLNSERDNFVSGTHLYTNRSNASIEITFDNIPKDNNLNKYVDNNCLIVRITYSPRNKSFTYQYKKGSYHNTKSSIIDYISEHIRFVYIPPFRDTSMFQWQERTLLHEVVHEYLEHHTSQRDSISPQFKTSSVRLNFGKISQPTNLTSQ